LIIPLAYAQAETGGEIGVPMGLGWIVASWAIYNVIGLAASLTSGEGFDGVKFGKTVLVTVIVAVIALALKIPPVNVTAAYGPVIDLLVIGLLNTAPGVTLMWAINRIWIVVASLKKKVEAARPVETPPKT